MAARMPPWPAESPRQGRCFLQAGASKTERRILIDGFSEGPRATNSREEWPSSAIGTSDGLLFNRGGDCRAGNLPAVRRVASVSHLLVVLVAPVPATAGSVLIAWGRFPTCPAGLPARLRKVGQRADRRGGRPAGTLWVGGLSRKFRDLRPPAKTRGAAPLRRCRPPGRHFHALGRPSGHEGLPFIFFFAACRSVHAVLPLAGSTGSRSRGGRNPYFQSRWPAHAGVRPCQTRGGIAGAGVSGWRGWGGDLGFGADSNLLFA